MKTWMLSFITLPLAGVSGVAVSDPVTYDFTVTAVDGPLSGDVANGGFTFNSSIAPAGGGFVTQSGLLTALSFTWDGITYSSSTANTGAVGFNASGTLTSVLFGDFCDGGSCSSGAGTETWFVSGSDAGSGFAYSTPSSSGDFNGTVTFSPELAPRSVPEPGTLSLLGVGLAGVGLMRRRKKS
jgi:hypothetical protein